MVPKEPPYPAKPLIWSHLAPSAAVAQIANNRAKFRSAGAQDRAGDGSAALQRVPERGLREGRGCVRLDTAATHDCFLSTPWDALQEFDEAIPVAMIVLRSLNGIHIRVTGRSH